MARNPSLSVSMPLTVLGDDDVRLLLHSLKREDILNLQQALGDALHYYSSGEAEAENQCSADMQPHRTQILRKDGSSTLFMPGMSNDGLGIKVVTLSDTDDKPGFPALLDSTNSSLSSFSLKSRSTGSSLGSSDVPSFPAYPSSDNRSGIASDTTLIGSDSLSKAGSAPSSTSPSGTLTLMDKQGVARAFINAAELTAFRTALASTMIFNKRQNVHDVVIFGAAKQAYWHARLALILRGTEVHHLNVINRSFERGVSLMKALYNPDWPVTLPHPKGEILSPGHQEYDRLLKSHVRGASAIFFTTPSKTPLFPAEFLTSTEGRKKGRYLAAIGSYKPHMCEIHPEIIRQAIAPSHKRHHHKHATQGGAIVVDSVESCFERSWRTDTGWCWR